MRKPRSQHARLLAFAASFRDALWFQEDISSPVRAAALERAREQIAKARAVRLAMAPDPLIFGTVYPRYSWSFGWIYGVRFSSNPPPAPPGGGGAAAR